MKPDCLVICGPTASGKTALAVALAQRLNGEVGSADSMQVYRTMDIGTAKPTREEMQGVPHHMLDVADPWENYSVSRYVTDAIPVMDDILARGKLPIVAGGTGLYIDHLMAGRQFAPFDPTPPRYGSGCNSRPGRRGWSRCGSNWPRWTRTRQLGCTPTTKSASSGPWRCTSPRERPSPSTRRSPRPSPPGITPSPSAWTLKSGPICGSASTSEGM